MPKQFRLENRLFLSLQKRKAGREGVLKSSWSICIANRQLGVLANDRDEGEDEGRGGVVGLLQTMKENCNMRTGHSHTRLKG